MMQIIPPSQAEVAIRQEELKRDFTPVWRVLQGLFILGIGIVFLVVNLGRPYQEMTGQIQELSSVSTVEGQYSASYLQLSTASHDLFIFDKNALHPAWTDQFFTNERVDVYYSDGTPKHIVALQMYDRFGRPTTKFTTTEYTNSLNASPLSNVGRDLGVILILLGAVWAGMVVFAPVRTRRQ